MGEPTHSGGRRSLLLHLHPARVCAASLRPRATLGLGIAAIVLLALLLVSGLLLMPHYTPTPERAHDDVRDIVAVVPFGDLTRRLHRLATHALLIVVGLHLLRVYLSAAYRGRRLVNWLVGLGLLATVLLFAFTGYLLPWDQTAYWACTVGADMVALWPGIGPWLKRLFLGGDVVGARSLLRFYVLHVALLPTLIGGLLVYHLWRLRKDGGLARNGGDGP
ncbi:MAG: cytochrome b N-terminal domain-containing protein [Deltaproteobacteria bacterium]|nr:cytochrome b N-terminal domain-containing protein [Deltaproteobacteria bacterium]